MYTISWKTVPQPCILLSQREGDGDISTISPADCSNTLSATHSQWCSMGYKVDFKVLK